jgi:hypothetical protein
MYVREEGNIGKCTGGEKAGGMWRRYKHEKLSLGTV